MPDAGEERSIIGGGRKKAGWGQGARKMRLRESARKEKRGGGKGGRDEREGAPERKEVVAAVRLKERRG
jgi:hypothetical protein